MRFVVFVMAVLGIIFAGVLIEGVAEVPLGLRYEKAAPATGPFATEIPVYVSVSGLVLIVITLLLRVGSRPVLYLVMNVGGATVPGFGIKGPRRGGTTPTGQC